MLRSVQVGGLLPTAKWQAGMEGSSSHKKEQEEQGEQEEQAQEQEQEQEEEQEQAYRCSVCRFGVSSLPRVLLLQHFVAPRLQC